MTQSFGTYIFPFLLALLNFGAAVTFAVNGDYKRCAYFACSGLAVLMV